MRTFALMLFAVTSPSVILPQEPAPRPVLVDDVPQGTNWVANARTRIYYRVGCPITASIPAADKLYYKDETSLQKVGFTRSDDCDVSGAANAVTRERARVQTVPSSQYKSLPGSGLFAGPRQHLTQLNGRYLAC